MLIQSLKALNFRKYQQLNITDLPEQGVITVSGLNESGKSSIGEAICFALFGRTFNLSGTAIKKLIRWESDKADVALTITDENQQHYVINRSINSDGSSDATLTDVKTDKVIAKGVEATDLAIHKLLGYSFDTFTDSFYLVARDLSNPDPNSNSIKQMAGIAEYSKVSDELAAASVLNQQKMAELGPVIEERESALAQLELDETLLPELVDAREVMSLEGSQKQSLNGELAELTSEYTVSQKQYHRTQLGRRFLNFLTWILVPLMLIAWGIWILFNFFPELVTRLSERPEVAPHFDTLQNAVNEWGFQVTMGLVLLTSLVLLFKWHSESKSEVQLEKAESLSNTLASSHQHSQRSLDSLITARLRQSLQGKINTQSVLSSPPQDDQQRLVKLTTQCKDYSADANEIDNTVQRLRDTLDQQQGELNQLSEPFEVQIDAERVRSDNAGVIRSGLRELQQQLDENNQQVKTQDTGIELLQRASNSLVNDFNASITSRTEKTMPLFTSNRYKQIKISNDLSVQVYSDEKMDWIDFDELSSGTQRQILLAVRIAMSEQLARNTDNERQFIFLDEPFTYFDQDRTKSSLAALPKINDTTCQVWIVAQEFPEGSYTDKRIHCPETDNHVLNA